jgi:TorA maturation chaperone TorD
MDKTEKQQRAAVAGMRSSLYGLLATVYRQEAGSELLKRIRDPQFLGVLSDLGVDWSGDFSRKSEEEILEDLAVEYAMLFLGPGKHISPHESVHHQREDGQWGQLWGGSTVEVKKFIETAGFDYRTEFTGMPDHISAELEFMERVTEREEQAWKENDEKAALYCRKIEKKFIEEHLLKWIPDFCGKVTEAAELPFYRDMAVLTKQFMSFEKEEIDRSENMSKERASAEIARGS